MHPSNKEFIHAFPGDLHDDAIVALSTLPENPLPSPIFTAAVTGQIVVLPYRIYHDTALIDTSSLRTLQKEIVDSLLTRHNDGFVRQQYLTRIIALDHVWIPPFVIQLIGEYVVEILEVIQRNLKFLDTPVYREFLQANPELLATTKQRVASYWDCYYRNRGREEYVGFQVLDFLESVNV